MLFARPTKVHTVGVIGFSETFILEINQTQILICYQFNYKPEIFTLTKKILGIYMHC